MSTLMLYAVSEPLPVPEGPAPEARVALYEAVGRPLANGDHERIGWGDLLELDTYLEQAGYPPGFRYAQLLFPATPLPVTQPGTESQLFGYIDAESTARAARMDRAWIDEIEDDQEAAALEELLDGAELAHRLGRGLASYYP